MVVRVCAIYCVGVCTGDECMDIWAWSCSSVHRAYPPSAHPGDSGGFPDDMKSEIITAVNQRVVQSASDTGLRGQDSRFGMAVYDSVVYVVIVCSVWCVGAADACAESVGAGAIALMLLWVRW